MNAVWVVAGTDTGVGKTVFAAALTLALGACYWKPVQAGLETGTDEETVRRLTRLPDAHFVPSAYVLRTAASPHLAARLDGVAIDTARLALPAQRPLVVELAGGLLVPLNDHELYIDVVARWKAPVVLVARTMLGTINHSLLSLEALARRSIPVHGIAFVGDANEDSEQTIAARGAVRRLGRLPWLAALDAPALARAFEAHFDRNDFARDEAR